jgi:hypothetical protein
MSAKGLQSEDIAKDNQNIGFEGNGTPLLILIELCQFKKDL